MQTTTICLNGKLEERDIVVAAPCSTYGCLIGRVLKIHYVGTPGHDETTDNLTDDIVVDFSNGYSGKRISEIEEQFRCLYDDDTKTFDELPIDWVIMSPDELLRIDPKKIGTKYYKSLLDSEARTSDWCFNTLLNFIHSQPQDVIYTTTVISRINGIDSCEEKRFLLESSAYGYVCERYSDMLKVFNARQNVRHEPADRSAAFYACGEERGTDPKEGYSINMVPCQLSNSSEEKPENKKEMKRNYRIPLVWQVWGYTNVEAESEDEAIEYALGPDCPLPEGNYIDDSMFVDDTTEIEVSDIRMA